MEFQIKDGTSSKCKNSFKDGFSYEDFIKSSHEFNHKLVEERKFRLPFLDSQTGVAQSDCSLWMTEKDRQKDEHRCEDNNQVHAEKQPQINQCHNNINNSSSNNDFIRPSTSTGRIYTYPAKRWVKRKRQYLLDDVYLKQRLSSSTSNLQQNHLSSGLASSNQDQSMILDHSSNDTQPLLQQNTHHTHPHLQTTHHHQNSLSTQNRISDMNSIHDSFNNHNDNMNNNNNNDSSFIHDSSSNSNVHPWTINEQSKDATTSSKVDPDDSTSEATVPGDHDDSNDPQHAMHQNFMNHHNDPNHLNQNQDQSSLMSTDSATTPTPSKKKRESKHKIERSNDPLKPYKCDWCDMCYKTRPGLSYHKNRCHMRNAVSNSSDETVIGDEPGNSNNHNDISFSSNHSGSNRKTPSSMPSKNHVGGSNTKSNGNSGNNRSSSARNNGTSRINSKSDNNNGTSTKKNTYCDFCLGNSDENKKTKLPEELVSCSDCPRSAHPSCLNWGPNIIKSIAKYNWQCILCKSCGPCGTSVNDDKLLFCDDCDRGYHMYCLNPPLDEPPDGSWSCSLCIEEYHSGKQDDAIEQKPQIQPKEESQDGRRSFPLRTVDQARPTDK